MISALIDIVILFLVFSIFYWVISAIPLPDPFRRIATVALSLILILILLGLLLPLAGLNSYPWNHAVLR